MAKQKVFCGLSYDRGTQFTSELFKQILANNNFHQSVGRVGHCADNAAMESFFALLQNNVLDNVGTWSSREELRLNIVYWIEAIYHRKRKQDELAKLTLFEYHQLISISEGEKVA